MKKLLLIAAVAVFSLNVNAQETKFGVTAGFTNITSTAKSGDISASVGEAGFYLGVLADIIASEKVHVQPSVLYANAGEANFLYIPVMAKFYVSDEFSLQAGPQANFILEETGEDFSGFGLDLGFGAAYDINENFFIEARYSLELTNRFKGSEDISSKFNTLNVGLGYKFN